MFGKFSTPFPKKSFQTLDLSPFIVYNNTCTNYITRGEQIMKVIITENYDEMSKKAAEIMIALVKNNPNAVLGLATGSSPIGMYQYMAKDREGLDVFLAICLHTAICC